MFYWPVLSHLSGLVFYMVAELNLVWVQTRMNGFLNGISILPYLYGTT